MPRRTKIDPMGGVPRIAETIGEAGRNRIPSPHRDILTKEDKGMDAIRQKAEAEACDLVNPENHKEER